MNKRLNEFRQHQYKQQFAAITPCASKTAKQYIKAQLIINPRIYNQTIFI
jgi:hypothetical protein